ncbi:MAG: sulfatase-like hydrolase/transferase [Armatimonadia bacterium]|nr:sulfatase-like hydrolase/transferase [Armatimonadia bacterium]
MADDDAPRGSDVEQIRNDGPNVLMVMADQHRADWMGCAGAEWVHTPNLDALAERGTRFTRAVCNAPVSAPSRAALASGRRCSDVGVLTNGHLFPYDVPTYYQHLRVAGYRVGCVGKTDLHKRDHWEGARGDRPVMHHLGFTDPTETEGKMSAGRRYDRGPVCPYQHYLTDRGLFDRFVEDYSHTRKGQPVWYAADSVLPAEAYHDEWIGRTACDFLREVPPGSPWHYFVSFVGPHDPWDSPSEYMARYRDAEMPSAIADPLEGKPRWHVERAERMSGQMTAEDRANVQRQYCGMVELIDTWLGRMVSVLKARGMYENTVIIYCADHGELLGDHGLFQKQAYYESSVRVPILVAGPGVKARGDCDALVELYDLAPTVLEIGGAEALPEMSARSLMPVLRGEEDEHREYQFSELHGEPGRSETRMVFDGRHKLIERAGDLAQLYDLAEDPGELINLVERDTKTVARLRDVLDDQFGPLPQSEPTEDA